MYHGRGPGTYPCIGTDAKETIAVREGSLYRQEEKRGKVTA